MYKEELYFRNVIMFGMDLGARVLNLRQFQACGKNRVHNIVNVLRYAIRVDFFQQCIVIVCTARPFRH